MAEINWVKEETTTKAQTDFEKWRSDAIAAKMASELKTARMDARIQGYAEGYKAGWDAAVNAVIAMLKDGEGG